MKHSNVDDYIAAQTPEQQVMLQEIRGIIRSVVPQAEELINYMVPCYKLHGMFIGFGVHKSGCSLYAMNVGILDEFAGALAEKGIKVSGSTIHFDVKKKLPVSLIKKIVKSRAKQNIERAKQKAIK